MNNPNIIITENDYAILMIELIAFGDGSSSHDAETGGVSVIEPLGQAMLGRRTGDIFSWMSPTGPKRMKVAYVHSLHEPTAAIA